MTAEGIAVIVAGNLTLCQISHHHGPSLPPPPLAGLAAVDLTFAPAEEEFRAAAAAWLETHVPARGSLASLDTAEGFEQHRRWERTMAADRWSVVNWPTRYGGRDAGIVEWLIF